MRKHILMLLALAATTIAVFAVSDTPGAKPANCAGVCTDCRSGCCSE